jgi:hypothetical protein
VERFAKRHPSKRTEEGLQTPVLRVRVPSKPTIRSTASAMLSQLGEPSAGKGTEAELTARVLRLLPAVGTKLLILDEFQHFVDRSNRKIQMAVADWAKTVVDECKVALVVAGLHRSRNVIDANEQLARRFYKPVELPRFDWSVPDQRDDFLDILGTIQDKLDYLDAPDFTSDELGFRFYCASGGLIGYLIKILRFAESRACQHPERKLTVECLQAAHDWVIWHPAPLVPRPFDLRVPIVPSDEVLGEVRQIGAEDDRVPGVR